MLFECACKRVATTQREERHDFPQLRGQAQKLSCHIHVRSRAMVWFRPGLAKIIEHAFRQLSGDRDEVGSKVFGARTTQQWFWTYRAVQKGVSKVRS
jgi:hypothetical protein